MKKLLILALALITISLTGCGTTSPTAGGGVTLPAYYVNAATGLDTNAGTQAAPFKTITKALATASTGTALNIFVATGTYDAANGEVFPLVIASSGINLIGDAANKGVGAASTTITGAGNYTITGGGVYDMSTLSTALAVLPGVSATTISGFDIGGAQTGIIVNTASGAVTISSNTLSTHTSYGILGVAQANLIITSNKINSPAAIAIDLVDASTTAKIRGNYILGSWGGNWGAVIVGDGSTDAIADLGTAADPGNNTILGGATGVGLSVHAPTTTVNAAGNTWKPNVQGADALGHYPATLVIANGAPFVAGNNYGNGGFAGIQLYGQSGSTLSTTTVVR